jgi:hypothetical protein
LPLPALLLLLPDLLPLLPALLLLLPDLLPLLPAAAAGAFRDGQQQPGAPPARHGA